MPASANPVLDSEGLHRLLAVTRALAAPFELNAMLSTVAAAACHVLHAERASVWMLEDDGTHLRLEVTSDLGALRLALGQGLVGRCAAEVRLINVADCYADPRFNPEMDRRSGYHTRCLVAVPLVDDRGLLVGVLQVLNRHEGVFGPEDEALAEALAAQCAVALSRVRMLDAMRAAERLQQEVALASDLQRSTLPTQAPCVPGYALHGAFRPASQTGGDTWDLAHCGSALLVLLADAVGHGLPAALSIVQMHAMLRLALDGEADLGEAYRRVNNRLAESWTEGRFATAFVGLLDPTTHRLRYISGGQGPIVLARRATGLCEARRATLFPMGAMPLARVPRVEQIELEPGDRLVLLSDGFYEYEDAQQRPFGRAGVEAVLAARPESGPDGLVQALFEAALRHAGGQPQLDDMTAVVVQRLAWS